MCLDEFIDMFVKAELVDDHFGQREIGPLFNLSQMTNKHELEKSDHLDMNFVEFLEALARCADKFDLQYMEDHFPLSVSKNPFELDKKLEGIIYNLMKAYLTPKQFE